MGDSLVGMTFSFVPAPPSKDDGQAPRGGLGSQVLPVAELGDDFAGDPEDGSQYLFLVRREAATHAKVLRVDNPYAAQESAPAPTAAAPSSRPSDPWREAFVRNFQAARQRMLTAPIHSMPPVDPGIFPPPRDEGAWRVFINGKRSKPPKPAPAKPSTSKSTSATAVIEQSTPSQDEDVEMGDDLEAAKAAILASLDLDAPEPSPARPVPAPKHTHTPASSTVAPSPAAPPQVPEFERLPQLPSPALLVAIPRPTLVHLLSHFHDWFVERIEAYEDKINYVPSTIFAPPSLRRRPGAGAAKARATAPAPAPLKPAAKPPAAVPRPPLPTAHESHWILSVLTRLEQLLDGEDLSSLRLLAKTLASMAEVSEVAREKRTAAAGAGGRSMQERLEDEEEAEGRARCWMVVAAIAGVWAQADLWDATL
ncbi:hypothetical protein JCM3775_006647 [Rhodotorula graminis]|uniref:Proteophosphoglycan 5 n=1 Tax=Rhodotorula graminis (strain WP1) TaxID=578459 RepID=A0A194S641_RHOGW|nr:uncharacterized protein RHOBADRAFT_53820 [Rhodotorula graminis WP1]KPV74891.1 hypothetical protein RHOBADRAFT_53820 [Rhodotorula graminis WP1]